MITNFIRADDRTLIGFAASDMRVAFWDAPELALSSAGEEADHTIKVFQDVGVALNFANFPDLPRQNLFSDMTMVRAAFASRVKGEQIEVSEPTRVDLLEACESWAIRAAVDRIATLCGEDDEAGIEHFRRMLVGDQIELVESEGAGGRQFELTSIGKRELFDERTRLTRPKAYSILDEIDAEEAGCAP